MSSPGGWDAGPGPAYGDAPRYGPPPGQPAGAPPPGFPIGPTPGPPYGYPTGPPQPWPNPAAPVPLVPGPYAPWIRRVAGYLLDLVPSLVAQAVFYVGYVRWLVAFSRSSARGAEPDLTVGLGWMVAGGALGLAALGWQIYNRWIVAGRTGQSWGKRVIGSRLVGQETGAPIGPLNAFLRDLVHILDGLAYVGFLWPLWDARRQTFADMIMRTVVVDMRPRA